MSEDVVRVFFCSSDSAFAQVIARTLGPGYEVRSNEQLDCAANHGAEQWWDVILLDLRDVGEDSGTEAGLRALDEIKQLDGSTPIIAFLGDATDNLSRMLVENGAYDTVATPPNVAELRLLLRRAYRFQRTEKELIELRSQDRGAGRLGEMLGSTESMHRVFATSRKVACCDVSVLITGETGTGKELLARAIHRLSPRTSGPFVAFSCANLPETLVDDELFGHEKGAFTGLLPAGMGALKPRMAGRCCWMRLEICRWACRPSYCESSSSALSSAWEAARPS